MRHAAKAPTPAALVLLLGVLAGPALSAGPGAYRFDFSEDRDYDGFPDRWWWDLDLRNGYYQFREWRPRLVLASLPSGVEGPALEVPLYGRNTRVVTDVATPDPLEVNPDVPPRVERRIPRRIPLRPEAAYRLTGQVLAQGLDGTRVTLQLHLYGERGEPAGVLSAPAVVADGPWVEVAVDGLEDLPATARSGAIALVVQSPMTDHEGWVRFADVRLEEVPWVGVRAARDLLAAGDALELAVETRSVPRGDYSFRVGVRSYGGREVAYRGVDERRRAVLPGTELPLRVDEAGRGKLRLRLVPEGEGYMEVRVRLLVGGVEAEGRSLPLVVTPAGPVPDSPLGVRVDARAVPPEALAGAVERVGARWMKFEAWRGDLAQDALASELPGWEALLGRLRSAGCGFVGVLGPEAAALRESVDRAAVDSPPASVFDGDAALWEPWVLPTVQRFADTVGFWQFGEERPGGSPGPLDLAPVSSRVRAAVPWGRVGRSAPVAWRRAGGGPLAAAPSSPEEGRFLADEVPESMEAQALEGRYPAVAGRPPVWLTLELGRVGPGAPPGSRLGDLARKVFSALREPGVERAFLAPLIDPERGLLLSSPRDPLHWRPTPCFAEVRTLAGLLDGTRFAGELENPVDDTLDPAESTWLRFEGRGRTLVVGWADGGPRVEPFHPGRTARQVELTGNAYAPALGAGGRMDVGLSREPVLLDGVDAALLDTLAEVGFDDDALEALTSPQRRSLRVVNRYPAAVLMRCALELAPDWHLESGGGPVERSLEPGEALTVPFQVRLPITVGAGARPVGVRLTVEHAGGVEVLDLVRGVEVRSPLVLEARSVAATGDLAVSVKNGMPRPLRLVLYWVFPGQPPREVVVPELAPGRRYDTRIPYPASLRGQRALVGLRDGESFANREVVLE
ncbi:MAG: hypothetical protein HY722_14175 [Planctomycetes bacterium]|nr:hypothetical protein [Planctomycetota bacterium]